MDFAQVKRWMQKMNQIMDLYEKEEEFTQTEKELLLDYNKRIKEQILLLKTLVEQDPIPVRLEPTPVIKSEPIPVVQAPPVIEEKIIVHESKPMVQEPEVKTIEPITSQPLVERDYSRYNSLFEHLHVTDLAEKLTITPIKDLKSAFGLNEKILAQNELFGGNSVAFDECLSTLNKMENFGQAKSFICEQLISKYAWDDVAKSEIVKKTIKTIYRRYL